MRIGIMQPYFFPYIGYFMLIKSSDYWIVFDNTQYINKGWINRNRILSQTKGEVAYISVPIVKKGRGMLINDAEIDQAQRWKEKILGQIDYYKKKAPFYLKTKRLVEEILSYQTNYISELNVFALENICNYLSIDFNYSVFSKMNTGIYSVNTPDEWALEITKYLGGNSYVNPPGGKSFFNKEKYLDEGIDLKFLIPKLIPYKTFSKEFIPGLSIIDVLMFNSVEKTQVLLDEYTIE